MISHRRLMWHLRYPLQRIKRIAGWLLLILFFMSTAWFLIYILESFHSK